MMLPLRVAFTGIFGGLFLAATGSAQDASKSTIAPEARARLDALIASYRAVPAYADRGETTLVVQVGGKSLRQVQKASVMFVRPGKLDVQTDLVRVVADGSTVTTIVAPLKKFQATPAPKKLAESLLRGGPLGAIEFGGVAGRPLAHVLNLVIGDEPERLIFDFAPRVVVEPDLMVEGTAYRVLRLDEADNDAWRFLIDPKTGLLAFIDRVIEGDAAKSSLAGGDVHVESLRWAAGAVATEIPQDDAFRVQTPAGFTAVAKLEGSAPVKKAESQDHPLVGKPAPPFTLDVLGGPGEVRRVPLADLAGKVVLIDFWATWCGPCLQEMPDIQGLIEAYAKDKKEVVIVALSIDHSETGDLKETRAKVEATLTERKLKLTPPGNPVGLVALDPLGKIAADYDVQAIPFVVLLDAKGVVRAVHIGVTDRETLSREIDALLATKPVEAPAAK